MTHSRSVNELLRRLADALLPTWPAGWRWHPPPSRAGYDRAIADSLVALDALCDTGEWRAIPSVLDVLAHENAAVRTAAANVIDELAARIPIAALPGFEVSVRDSTLQAMSWPGAHRVREQVWPPRVVALFTLHPSGYVREAAVNRLALHDDAAITLPYLLLRINDWVSQVRIPAVEAVGEAITWERITHWIPLLGLVEQLQHRSRADHAWLSQSLSALFLQPDAREALTEAAKSSDRRAARWAFSTAMKLLSCDRAAFIWLGLGSSDQVLRTRAASAARTAKDCPGRDQLLDAMKADRFMPVRREALYAMLDEPAETRGAYLESALLDPHASMRHAARFYLRQHTEQTPTPFDARIFYLGELNCAPINAAAIAGVGETGTRNDARELATFVAAERTSIAAAAVRAIATLDRDDRVSWFADRLKDPRPAVAREAARALLARGKVAPVECVRTILREGPHTHSRRLALRVLLRRHPYEAIADAIAAAASPDPSLARTGQDFLERAGARRMPCGPSESQKCAVAAAIASSSPPLPENLVKQIRDHMGMPASS